MEPERYKQNDEDRLILELVKHSISKGIEELRKRNFRTVNIEIELGTHIQKELKK